MSQWGMANGYVRALVRQQKMHLSHLTTSTMRRRPSGSPRSAPEASVRERN